MIGDTEMMIGEYNTRLAKIIKFIENKNKNFGKVCQT